MTFINDGTGKNFAAKVDELGKLTVKSTSHTEEHIVSAADGQSYFANTTDTANTLTISTGETINMLYLKNTSATLQLVIQKILFSADTAATVLVFQKNMVLGSVGNENLHVPVNMNFTSGHAATVLCYNWDEVGTTGITGLTAGTKVKSFINDVGFQPHPIDGSMVLGQNDSITLIVINGTGGDVEAECGIRFYMDTPET